MQGQSKSFDTVVGSEMSYVYGQTLDKNERPMRKICVL